MGVYEAHGEAFGPHPFARKFVLLERFSDSV
jgi:hypothetical protein